MFEEQRDFLRESAWNLLRLELSTRQLEQFSLYGDMLVEWNGRLNLTAITGPREIVIKHFLDSLALDRHLKGLELADIGTGAGFPGLPLKIIRPDRHMVLVDSLAKRLKFLDAVIQKLGLVQVETVHARAEEFGRMEKYRERFDTVVSRAVAGFPVLLEYALPVLKSGGLFLAAKGSKAEEEIAQAQNALALLHGKVIGIKKFSLGSEAEHRSVIIVEKTMHISQEFPRKPGIPNKKPL